MDSPAGYGSAKEMEFAESFETAVKVVTRGYSIIEGTITTVDEATLSCTVTVGDSISSVIYDNVYLDVLLIGQGSFICIPTVGSNCILAFRNGSEDRRQLLKSFSYDKIIAAPVAWQFGQGANGGIPMVNPLVTQLNTIIEDINTLKQAFAAWVVVPEDGGAALKAVAAEWFGNQLSDAEATNLENPNVTQ